MTESTKTMIDVQGLGKSYRLGQTMNLTDTLRDRLAQLPHKIVGSLKKAIQPKSKNDDLFWALREVDLKVNQGEVIGIIGANGAGKSTLLKILSRITTPTTGAARIYGRVGSLLEVGTGFHPELSGRENIFLNGAILGMRRSEIVAKLDEIVAFAEIQAFLDTPVKRYSSGMRVRLAFAVAAHLEPEVLLIDEVLAVGDVAFQKRCLGKMQNVASEGRTILFVSHNMAAVANLCSRCILLQDGRKTGDGNTAEMVNRYIQSGQGLQGERIWPRLEESPGNDKMRITAVRLISDGQVTAEIDITKDITVEIDYRNLCDAAAISVSIHLIDKMGVEVLGSGNMHSANLSHDPWFGRDYPEGTYRTRCILPGNFLNDGQYSIHVMLVTNLRHIQARQDHALTFMVHDTGEMKKEYTGGWLGVVRPKLAWQSECLSVQPDTIECPCA